MHSFTRSCLLGLCLTLSLPLAMAQSRIDQNQPEASLPIAGLYQTGLAQSFQTAAASITGAGAMLRQTEEAGPITISLWDALPSQGGVKLAEGVARGLGSTWVDTFWTPVQATAGKTYFLVFTSDIPYFILNGSDDVYKFGMAYANDYAAFPQYDYAFRTYAGPAAPPVPEPATVAMLLAGLSALILRRRFLG
ncbi:PEP-CTERM sorting domain-containing protein [Pseudoduganella sp. FT55W]|uniref:PEP-CTERM sorting domain-containing protein n=1 Tax=Duganella rivi TaxID=2666083 RepID=A0A7X4GLB5_9BURK|nr:PEP-CTERM sorting domain-containing protein [Duganella rivi]MYM65607.1 PEP-CTERM sorting domain-containing protein [Duganella rivi]